MTVASRARPAHPSILNASPEAAAGGNLVLLKTGDPVRTDLNTCKVDVGVVGFDPAEILPLAGRC